MHNANHGEWWLQGCNSGKVLETSIIWILHSTINHLKTTSIISLMSTRFSIRMIWAGITSLSNLLLPYNLIINTLLVLTLQRPPSWVSRLLLPFTIRTRTSWTSLWPKNSLLIWGLLSQYLKLTKTSRPRRVSSPQNRIKVPPLDPKASTIRLSKMRCLSIRLVAEVASLKTRSRWLLLPSRRVS